MRFALIALMLFCAPCYAGSSHASFGVGLHLVAPGATIAPAAPTTIARPEIGHVLFGTHVGARMIPPKVIKANAGKC
jgi:hypothetical protein